MTAAFWEPENKLLKKLLQVFKNEKQQQLHFLKQWHHAHVFYAWWRVPSLYIANYSPGMHNTAV